MQLLLDTNVVLDVLLKREPRVADAVMTWQAQAASLARPFGCYRQRKWSRN